MDRLREAFVKLFYTTLALCIISALFYYSQPLGRKWVANGHKPVCVKYPDPVNFGKWTRGCWPARR